MSHRMLAFVTLACLITVPGNFAARGEDAGTPAASRSESAAAADLESTRYLLRYKFQEGEEIRWKVVHLATTETVIQGNTQTSKSRAESTKLWRVSKVGEDGQMQFVHVVEDVKMWQQKTDHPEIRYDSVTDKEPPTEYEHVASTLGKPLATVTITPDGTIVERDGGGQVQFGLGDIVMLLPPNPVKLGGSWFEPSELQVREKDGRVKRIKIRRLYRLEKVQTGVATITVTTEVLTPLNNPALESQLMQQLTAGTIRFDVDAGRLLSKQIDWDKSVVGFNGADSMIKYMARLTEELSDGGSESDAGKSRTAEVRIERKDSPAVRR